MVATPNPITAEQLWTLDLPHKRTELVRGRLIVCEPPGLRHAEIVGRIAYALVAHVRNAPGPSGTVGRVFAGDPGFWIERNPDTVRAPDVAFVSHERLPTAVPVGFAALAPNLAVEVLSPSDRAGTVLAKVADWLSAGAELVWVIDPDRRVARVHRADGSVALVGSQGSLDGESVLPGFALPLVELFD